MVRSTWRHAVTIVLILGVFVAASWATYKNSSGDDLSSGYIACRLIATGADGVIYSHHPQFFHVVDNTRWGEAAKSSGFNGMLHPYVQTPLWAMSLQPLCTRLAFPEFNSIFILLAAVATALIVFLSSATFAPRGQVPWATAAVLLWMWHSLPFTYAMQLTQTHGLFISAALAALLLAERKHPIPAGILLAIAAAVKITPAALVLYWLATRKWTASASFAISSVALLVISIAAAGPDLMLGFLDSMRRVSDVLLVAYNNHSLAAAILAPQHTADLATWRMHPLPPSMKALSMCMLVAAILFAGHRRFKGAEEGAAVGFVMVAMTLFTPIAWSHYYIVLAIPLAWMLFQRWMALPAIFVALLACMPHSIHRTLVFASVVTMICLGVHLIGARRLPRETVQRSATDEEMAQPEG